MANRLIGFAIVVSWFVATGWLVWHDVLPAWTAQDPPTVVASQWVSQYGDHAQFGIYDVRDHWIGGVWTRYRSGTATQREDDIYLENLPHLGRAYINVRSEFDMEGRLDETDISVLGSWSPIRIHGERFHSDFAFRVDQGVDKYVFKIELDLAGTVSDAFRPLDAMPQLSVGQSWRMQVFNPIAAVTGMGDKFIPMLVRVVGREVLHVHGKVHDCLIVKTSNVKAWVDRASGVVLVQEISLPLMGKYVVRYEPYDEEALRKSADAFARYRDQFK